MRSHLRRLYGKSKPKMANTSSNPSVLTPFWPIRHFYTSEDAVHEIVLHEPRQDAAAIPEAFVQELWRDQRFSTHQLMTLQGDAVQVLHVGTHNTRSVGPDFAHARLMLGGIEWRGDVEIHVRSGDWVTHRHGTDPAYNKVVLHVTLFEDAWTGQLSREDGSVLPELVLFPFLTSSLRGLLFQYFSQRKLDFPCQYQWADVPEIRIRQTLLEQAEARMMRKADAFAAGEQALWAGLLEGLGYTANRNVMRMLAERVPVSVMRTWTDVTDREAVLLGCAGLLPNVTDLLDADRQTVQYVMALRQRFERIGQAATWMCLQPHQWQFGRMRPANFPTLRLAQAAAWFSPGGLLEVEAFEHLWDALCSAKAVSALRQRLQRPVSAFWANHALLTHQKSGKGAQLGRDRADILITNAILPAVWARLRIEPKPHFTDYLWDVLRSLPASSDQVTRFYRHPVFSPANQLEVQGLHELHRHACVKMACLTCPIGRAIFQTSD